MCRISKNENTICFILYFKMETLRRVVLNTTKTILPSEEYLNLEQPYQSLMVARKTRVKLLLFFLSQQFKEKIDVYFFLVSFFKKR